MENPLIDWRGICIRIVLRYYQIVADRSCADDRKITRCFVIDDTLLEKIGKCIEGINNVFDHITHRAVLGLKMLVLGYRDEFNFVTLDASHAEHTPSELNVIPGLVSGITHFVQYFICR